MRFLVDAQLPPLLVRHLIDLGHQAEHLIDAGLLQARDQDIWEYAREVDAVIITKDEDFIYARRRRTGGGLGRFGNTTRQELLKRFFAVFDNVLVALNRGETVVEVSDR